MKVMLTAFARSDGILPRGAGFAPTRAKAQDQWRWPAVAAGGGLGVALLMATPEQGTTWPD